MKEQARTVDRENACSDAGSSASNKVSFTEGGVALGYEIKEARPECLAIRMTLEGP